MTDPATGKAVSDRMAARASKVNGTDVNEALGDDYIPPVTEPPDDYDTIAAEFRAELDADAEHQDDNDDPTTWEPINLGPWIRGEVEQPTPSLGVYRSDGLRLIYPGREHVILGETESGKTWLALACVAAELDLGNIVVYIHYEEGDPGSTIERLRLLGVTDRQLEKRLRFVAPMRAVRAEWVQELLTPTPTMVVHDGVNEAMALMAAAMDVEGAHTFRRRLVAPFINVGAATVACDHMPMAKDTGRLDAYGTVHKGNALNGVRIALENVKPFGRHMRGVSHVFVTKDRPGHLREHGRPSGKTPGKVYMGTLIVDDSETIGPDFTCRFFAPTDEDTSATDTAGDDLADIVYAALAALPNHTATTQGAALAAVRAECGERKVKAARTTKLVEVLHDLMHSGRVIETSGPKANSAKGYRAVVNDSEKED